VPSAPFVFPRSSERGPVEVLDFRLVRVRLIVFPRSSERGPVEVITKSSMRFRMAGFPRSSERGPVEVSYSRAGAAGTLQISALI